MEKPLFWIIDDEWPDYSVEEAALKAAYPDCDIRYSGIPFQQDLEDFGAQADVVFAQVSADITADVIAKLKRCKGIAVFGSGYNNVDVQAAKAAGIRDQVKIMVGGAPVTQRFCEDIGADAYTADAATAATVAAQYLSAQ